MRRTAAACLVACGLLLLPWHWLAGPVASFSTHRAQSGMLRDVPDGPAGATRGSPAVAARAVAPAHHRERVRGRDRPGRDGGAAARRACGPVGNVA